MLTFCKCHSRANASLRFCNSHHHYCLGYVTYNSPFCSINENQMTTFYRLEPEVPREFGENTIMDNSVLPPVISKLEILIKEWQGDCFLECFPVYMLTSQVIHEIEKIGPLDSSR